jgi:hypothetical protein
VHLAFIYTGNSHQIRPATDRPFKVRGQRVTAKRVTSAEIQLTRADAVTLLADLTVWLKDEANA